ncbi:hypothetical protein ACFSBZ_06790 [Amnibacterium flavum]|uniref:DUF3180 domain-containing protein n=1 Tax=Amnibacterium flavum TaxID=2173173 RepID=A0A2V1HN73_9MICO|nr:hypothetical protein [Amnibacterium flavum]PVZ93851.1 hypothetical protein DDQ50_08700 [Amnibacterium flavum]
MADKRGRTRRGRLIRRLIIAVAIVVAIVIAVIVVAPEVPGYRMTLDGAALLATLYPIGVLAAIVDVRAITREPRVRVRKSIKKVGFALYSRPSAGMIAVLSLPAFMSVWPLANAVATGVAPKGWLVAFVGLSGTLLLGSLSAFVIELVWLAFKADVSADGATTPPPKRPPNPPNGGRRGRKKR